MSTNVLEKHSRVVHRIHMRRTPSGRLPPRSGKTGAAREPAQTLRGRSRLRSDNGLQAQKEERTMANETTVQGRIGFLQRLLARLSHNREELQHIEPSRVRLETVFGRLQEAADRQAFHTARKQEASQELQTFLTEGERLATILQLAVKQHYGIRSEKLA